MNEEIAELIDINNNFYTVFSSGDFRNMQTLWSLSDEISVIHPGMPAIHGHASVMQSWKEILATPGGVTIRCLEPRVYLHGNIAYVTCIELLSQTRLVATNIFARESNQWVMVHHQAAAEYPLTRVGENAGSSLH